MRREISDKKRCGILLLMVLALTLGIFGQASAQTLGPILTNDLVLGTADVPGGAYPVAAFDGTRYLLVWSQYIDHDTYWADIFGRFVSANGEPEGTPFKISQASTIDFSMAFNGTNFLVIWNEGSKVTGQLINKNGNLVGGPITISTGYAINERPEAASDGTDFLVVWCSYEQPRTTYGDIYGQKVSGSGALLGANFLITPGPKHQMYPTVEFGAGKYLVVWQESNQSNEFTVHLYGAFVDSSGVSGSFPICTSNGPKGAWGGLSLAFNGEKFLAAWTDYRTNNIQIYGTRITPSGVLLDGPPDIGGILISSYGDSPRVVANGSTWMVSWRAGKVYGARINADGSKYDTSSIPLSKDSYFWCYPDGLATDGVNYLVAWAASTANNAPHYLYAQLVGPVEPLNRPPVANAGADQSAHAGQKVTLNGSQSYDPDGDPLSYNWSFGSRPPNSNAVLINPNSVNPSFTPDLPGYYVVQLVVSDSHGATSAIDTVTISTGNTKPVAKAENQVIEVVNTKVTLDGSKSTDADNDPLTFTWTLVSRPDGSNAALNGTDQICPTFTADVHGTYRAQLVVSDPWTSSDPVVIEVTFTNVAPVANAGPDQSIDKIDVIVTLDGTGSTDANGDKLNYLWSVTKPDGLLAQLSDPSAVNPTFKADVHGTYVAQLTVSDGFSGTHTDTVTISFTNVSPVAEAGPNQSVQSYNTTVTLDGSQSYDANGDVLTYVWSFMNKPGESLATLTGADTEKPSFKADVHGDYVVQLTVSDGFGGTANDTVTVSFNNLPPTASAVGGGAYSVGQTVTLDGITSTDPNNDPLIYKWSLRSAPSGSAAVIAAPSASATSLTLDAKGQYEVQLVVNDGVVDSPPATVLITATLSTQAVIVAIQDLQQVTIGNLDPTVFKNSNMKNAMINKLSSVAANIEAGQYQEALGQLQHDLLAKTDGCATSGAPDKNDWIKSCENQAAVYQELQKIITMLQQLQ